MEAGPGSSHERRFEHNIIRTAVSSVNMQGDMAGSSPFRL